MGNNDNIKRLPDAELEIMKELWAADEPLTRPQLGQRLARKSWTSTTLLALLARLESKGAVSHEEGGKAKRYTAALPREDAARSATEQFLGKVYGGSLGLMMSAMVSSRALSQADIDELSAILEQAKEGSSS